MATITRTFARYFALPIVSAGIIGGAALGMAGMANAATQTQPTGPGYSYAPSVKAHPAPEARPGWHGHHGVNHIEHLVPATTTDINRSQVRPSRPPGASLSCA